jgi:hypothetical protein
MGHVVDKVHRGTFFSEFFGFPLPVTNSSKFNIRFSREINKVGQTETSIPTA